MLQGIIGRKIGMTQIFDKVGNLIPVTVIEAGPCTVLELKNDPLKIKIGFSEVRESRINKPEAGFFKKINVKPKKITREFKSTDNASYEIGQEVTVDMFKMGDFVDVTGTSIGKGFAGGMKRHGWSGGPGGHGSNHHRRVGSIGASADPSRTVKGFNMPGHMGARQITTQGLCVMAADVEKNLLLLKGAVPGHKNAYVTIKRSFKKEWKDLNAEKVIIKHKVNPMKQSKAKAGKKKG